MCYMQGERWIPCDSPTCHLKNPNARANFEKIAAVAIQITKGEIEPIGKVESVENLVADN